MFLGGLILNFFERENKDFKNEMALRAGFTAFPRQIISLARLEADSSRNNQFKNLIIDDLIKQYKKIKS